MPQVPRARGKAGGPPVGGGGQRPVHGRPIGKGEADRLPPSRRSPDQLGRRAPELDDDRVYQALYRIYRPHRFREVVGQPHAVAILRNALRRGRLGHAYLLSGPRGVGKTSLARIVAMAANCLDPDDGEPCLRCEACLNSQLYTVEIDAASNGGVDDTRDLRERAQFVPPIGRRRVYILDEAHMLSPQSCNVLLKILEEPPEHLVFLFATTAPEKMLPTVLSRCQRINLRRIGDAEVAAQLTMVAAEAKLLVSPEAVAWITRRAEGCMRDALAMLELAASYAEGEVEVTDVRTALGSVPADELSALLAAVLAGDGEAVLDRTAALEEEGADFRQLSRDLLDEAGRRLTAAYRGDPRPGAALLLGLCRELLDLESGGAGAESGRLGLEARLLTVAATSRQLPAVPAAPAAKEPAANHPPTQIPADATPLDLAQLAQLAGGRERWFDLILQGASGCHQGGQAWISFKSRGSLIRAEQEDARKLFEKGLTQLIGQPVETHFMMSEER